MAQHSASYKL